jgi:hypothetical protein
VGAALMGRGRLEAVALGARRAGGVGAAGRAWGVVVAWSRASRPVTGRVEGQARRHIARCKSRYPLPFF